MTDWSINMDVNSLRIATTLASFAIFIAIWAWAWSRSRRDRFEADANIPFEQD